MSAKENMELQRVVFALFSENRFDDVLGHATEDVVVEMIALGQVHRGHGGFREFMAGFKTAFPNLTIRLKSQVADDTRVSAEFTAVGTHSGPLMTPTGPVAATNREVTFTVCEVWDIRDGKLAGLRNYQDIGSVLRQIGVV